MLKTGRPSSTRDDERGAHLVPAKLEPMMVAHLALTGDRAQNARWRAQLEAIRQADAVDAAPDPQSKAILANKDAWKQMRVTGRLGSVFGLGLGSLWLAWLLPTYAVGHGFGWLAAASFLLPVPIAYKVGRKLWESASLAGMRDLGERPSFKKRLAVMARSMFRAFNAGFGFGFTLVFLTTLITWFMTPAPTLLAELMLDLRDGAIIGTFTGTISMVLAPLIGRGIPPGQSGLRSLGAGASLASFADD